MKTFVRCLLGIVVATSLTSCAAGSRIARAIDGIATVRGTPNGVEAEVHPRVEQVFDAFCTAPVLKQQYPQNLGDGWQDVTGTYYLTIPFGQGGANYWLITHGNVVEAWYIYNGVHHDINRGSWAFGVDNSGDGGEHELVVGWRYTGQVTQRFMKFSVLNNSIR